MIRYFINFILAFMTLILPVTIYSQKDVTQFLGIPVDGYKPEMIKKLKDKGFTNNITHKDVLVGEFNGTDVYIHIVTNNNKVCRIMAADINGMNEGDIKIRFNKLCQQFQNNNKYVPLSDTTVSKYTLSEDEDISYELLVHKKRYQAVFYQKTANYDSLIIERDNLLKKEKLTDTDKDHLKMIMNKLLDESNSNKVVWFMINQLSGKYYLTIFYDNNYNRANGEEL